MARAAEAEALAANAAATELAELAAQFVAKRQTKEEASRDASPAEGRRRTSLTPAKQRPEDLCVWPRASAIAVQAAARGSIARKQCWAARNQAARLEWTRQALLAGDLKMAREMGWDGRSTAADLKAMKGRVKFSNAKPPPPPSPSCLTQLCACVPKQLFYF